MDFRYVSATTNEVVILYNSRTRVKRYLTGDFTFLFDPAWKIVETIPLKPTTFSTLSFQETSEDGIEVEVSYDFQAEKVISKIEETLWNYKHLMYLAEKELREVIKTHPSYYSKDFLAEKVMKKLKPKAKEIGWILKSFSIPYKRQ